MEYPTISDYCQDYEDYHSYKNILRTILEIICRKSVLNNLSTCEARHTSFTYFVLVVLQI